MIEQIIIYIVANIVTVLTMEDFFSTFLEKRQTWKYIVAWVCRYGIITTNRKSLYFQGV